MSRLFDGQFTTPSVTFSPGSATFDQGPITVMALMRFEASAAGAFCYLITGRNASNADVWAMQAFDLTFFIANDFTAGATRLTTGAYYWVGVTHTAGGTPRWHIKNVQTGGAWSHADASGTVGDGTGPVTSIVVGNSSPGGGDGFRGQLAAIAVWSTALSDGAVQSACTLAASDLVTSAPAWGSLWNQASTATSVTDLTGGSGNQTAISATSVGTDEPPGWSYSLSTTVNAAAALAITATLTAGAVRTKPAGASLAVTATLNAAASHTIGPAAALAITAALSAGAAQAKPATGALSATASLAVGATLTKSVDAGLAVAATLSASTGASSVSADAALAATATLTTAAISFKPTAAALAITATLSSGAATGAAPKLAAAALTVTATLTAAPIRVALPAAALTVTATWATSATPARLAQAALAVTAALTVAAPMAQQVAAALAALATLTASTTAQGGTTPRPFTGATSRPAGGRTTRPFAGITPRP